MAASPVTAHGLESAGSVLVVRRLSCLTARGIFPDQGLNLCPLHWQVPTPCFLCSSQGSLCLTCCYLRACALAARSALNTFFRVPQLPHFLQSPFREALSDHPPLCILLQHFLSSFPSLLYFSPVTSLLLFPPPEHTPCERSGIVVYSLSYPQC